MIRGLLLVFVACTSRSAPDAGTVDPSHAAPAPPPVLTGSHGSTIDALAISDDGRAAVTQDVNGGTRVWPTLDGTREPIVIALAPTVQLAIDHAGDDVVIASRDEVGGVEIVRVAATGDVIAHARVAPDPAIEQVAVIANGVLAQRSDQTLATFDTAGQLVSRIAAPSRSRIKQVITRRGRILVLLEEAGTLRARWIVRGDWWGDTAIDVRIVPGSRFALSPSGAWLLVEGVDGVVLVDLAFGRTALRGVGQPIGFIDDTMFAVQQGTTVRWMTIAGTTQQEPAGEVQSLVAGDGLVLGAAKRSLMVKRRGTTEYLGYRIGQVRSVRAARDRVLVISGDQRPLYLDGELRAREVLNLPPDPRILSDAQPIDDRFVIATHTMGSSSAWSLSVLDRDEQKTAQTAQHLLARAEIAYEPSTQLLSISDSVASWLTPWDDTRHSFDTWYRVLGTPSRVHLLDPARHGGVVALAMRTLDGLLEINEIHHADLVVGKPVAARRTYRVGGQLAAADRAGNVYVIDQGALVVWQGGETVARIENVGPGQVTPHPQGDYIVVHGDSRIRLHDRSGARHWEIAAPLARSVGWLGEQLVVEYEGGLGKIDAATGALIVRACGWSFGLSALRSNDDRDESSICDAE